MVYRDRQELSPPGDPMQSSNNRDRYLDNCFLLCINRDDDTDKPEIHRLENHILRDLCHTNPLNKIKSRRYIQDQQAQLSENDDVISPRQQRDYDNAYRRKDNYPISPTIINRSRYQRDDTTDSYYTRNRDDQYSRTGRFNHRDDYNIMQHSDDELSVYEVYVPTNTLNRLSDKRTDNNMVLIDYEDVSMMRDTRGSPSPYGHQPRNLPSNQYGSYDPQYQYDRSPGYSRERNDQQQSYQNNPIQQQRLGGYYGNEVNQHIYSPQSGSFLPQNIPIDHTNAINVRRHMYSPSQLPQGLTEGQLVMLLQKGAQYQQSQSGTGPIQLFSTQTEPPQSTTSAAVTVSHQPSSSPSAFVEPLKTPEYVPLTQIKIPQVPPQIIDHRLVDEEKTSIIDEITIPMSTLNTTNSIKPLKDIELKESGEKKKDKTSDVKKDKKAEKEAGSSKKDGKKEKSSGKDGKKKKK